MSCTQVVPLVRHGEVEDECAQYMNRLSDFLFAAGRYAAHVEGKEVVAYKANHGKIFLDKEKR
jgi:cob(I)alamin adenosyltransferase